MIVVQDFETVTFYIVYKPTFSVIFCWMKMLRVSSQFNSLFILYIFTAKPFSLLVRGYIEVKINKHEIWWALTQLTLRCLKYIKGISVLMPFSTVVSWYLRTHFTEKERNRWRKFFPACSSSENATWSVLLKYHEIDVQIQTFTDENWNILHS